MIVSINQPAYLPWLGYYHRIAISDLHIVLDHVQFEKNSYVNRNKVRTKDGWCWLTVPVKTKGRFGNLPIAELEIADDARWAEKHWATIRQNYAAAAHFAAHGPFFQSLYARHWSRLAALMQEINGYVLGQLGISTRLVYSSQMDSRKTKSELVLELCRAAGATVYLSGPLGRDYLDEGAFAAAGIRIAYHDYRHPTYCQLYAGFEPGMSAIDVLFNYGPESMAVLANHNLTKTALLI
jgi:hypothetical protein